MPKVTISLTTIPPRFDKIAPTLKSLVNQSVKADNIRLYLAADYARFPDGQDNDIRRIDVPEGVEVKLVDRDLGPATKLLYALKDAESDDEIIVYCDDDKVYPRNWLKTLLKTHAKRPDDALVVSGWPLSSVGVELKQDTLALPRPVKQPRSFFDWDYRKQRIVQQWNARQLKAVKPKPKRRRYKRSGYVDIADGFGGVLVRRSFLDDRVFDIPNEGWSVDDIWLSACMAKAGTKIWLIAGASRAQMTEADKVEALVRTEFDGLERKALNLRCVRYAQENLGVWREA